MKRLIYIPALLILLFSCNNKSTYRIEGKLLNLEQDTIYAVFEYAEKNLIDTIIAEQGNFFLSHAKDETLRSITFYYHQREQWFKAYPENVSEIKIKGDARYHNLIQIKGGGTNNKLTTFKKKVSALLKEQAHITENKKIETLMKEESSSQIANINIELRHLAQEFITKNPKEKAAVILTARYFMYTEDLEQTAKMLHLLSPELSDFYMYNDLKKQVIKAKTTAKGATAPDFSVRNIYGEQISSSSFANKYYILAFTALWCEMCQTEIMMLDDIVSKYSQDSLEILLISLDDDTNEVRKLIKQDTIQWNLAVDSAGQSIELFEKYNVRSLPKCFLMDKNGVIQLRTSNGIELKQKVDKCMKPD